MIGFAFALARQAWSGLLIAGLGGEAVRSIAYGKAEASDKLELPGQKIIEWIELSSALCIQSKLDLLVEQFGIEAKAGPSIFRIAVVSLVTIEPMILALVTSPEFEFFDDWVGVVFVERSQTPQLIKGRWLFGCGSGCRCRPLPCVD